MKEVKELNDLYLRYDKELALFSKSKLTFESVKRYGPNSIDKKLVSEMLDSLTSLMNCSFVSEKIKRLVRLLEGYNSYLHSIDQYEKENLSYCDKSVSETKLEAVSDSFINARHLFSELKMQYSRDFNSSVVSPVDLCNEVISVIDECEEKTKNVIKVLLDDAFPELFSLIDQYEQASQYFSSDNDRVAKPTKSIKEECDSWIDGSKNYCWYLRSPGIFGKKNATVSQSGRVDEVGEWGDTIFALSDNGMEVYGIRPAMWVRLDKPVEMDHIDISHSDYTGEWSDPLYDPTEYVEFGYYGGEEIEWIVVDRKDGKTLLVSRYVLDAQLFNDKDGEVTWETCSLRTWLNTDFYNKAFNSAEQERIQLTKLTTTGNPESGLPGGNDTEDKVFLLSYDELVQYDYLGEHQVAFVTNYAYKQGAEPNGYNYCSWWLRSPGDSVGEVACVTLYGEQREAASGYLNKYGIRPAIWVDLDSPSEGNTAVEFDTSKYLMDYPVECSMTVYVKKAPYMEYPQKGISFMDQEHADYITDPCIHYITADKTFMNLDFYKEMNSPDHGYDVGKGSLYYSILSEESCQNGCTIYEIEEHSTWSEATSMIYLICWPVDANVTLLAEMDNFARNHEHDTELQEILEFYRTTEDPFIAVAQ